LQICAIVFANDLPTTSNPKDCAEQMTENNATITTGSLDLSLVEAALLEAAAAAAGITLKLFRSGLAVDNKLAGGFDPVTEADRGAELAIRAVIERHFPDHAIVGEEWDDKASSSEHAWIIDPIDGTRAFISGVPVWGTLIGLTSRGGAVAGLMAQPFTGETFFALPGRSGYRRGGEIVPLGTSSVTELARAKLTTTTPDLFETGDLPDVFSRLKRAVLQTRYGLDCYGYCLLALGQIDLVVEPGLKQVDIAPLIPIIEAAGGIITDFAGGPAENGGNCVAAATPELHAAALRLVQGL
jgi:histidinol phosphatase-like enzyme (inositol monophosphatase family)